MTITASCLCSLTHRPHGLLGSSLVEHGWAFASCLHLRKGLRQERQGWLVLLLGVMGCSYLTLFPAAEHLVCDKRYSNIPLAANWPLTRSL